MHHIAFFNAIKSKEILTIHKDYIGADEIFISRKYKKKNDSTRHNETEKIKMKLNLIKLKLGQKY